MFNAIEYFSALSARNKLCQQENFVTIEVSGLDGFLNALSHFSGQSNIIAVDETSDGYMALTPTPQRNEVKLVLMAMRHEAGNMQARKECLEIMREIFRQFASKLINDRFMFAHEGTTIDTKMNFSEIHEYFANGAACAFFEVAVSEGLDLTYKDDEWIQQ